MIKNYTFETLPKTELSGPSAWYGNDIVHNKDWIHNFTNNEIDELLNALNVTQKLEIKSINNKNFELPTLRKKFDKFNKELEEGRGFILLRGLPVSNLKIKEIARIYWGVGSYFGAPRSQNANGDLLGHVIDLSRSMKDPNTRLYQTSDRQNYHCDSTDIVGLLCLQKAMEGGESSLVSSITLFNEILRQKPDLLAELSFPFFIDRRGEIPIGKKPWYRLPVFTWYKKLLTTHYSRPYINSAQRFSKVPNLTNKQLEALDFFQSQCERTDIQLNMDFQPGDIQFLNNYKILHDRKAFKDWPNGKDKRHLLRLWLCNTKSRELHPIYLDRQESIDIGNRGGIVVSGSKQNVNFELN